MENKTVDARGMACPLPVERAKKASEEVKEGGVLTILVDNEIAVQNLTKFGTSKGYQVSSEKKAEKDFSVTFQIPAGTDSPAATLASSATASQDSISCQPEAKKNGMVVVLSANTMGNGAEQLGKLLMKSDSLEDLKTLEAEGVKSLTCGTCLDFYGLKEKLTVGGVTNMYEIVEIMERAGHIIRP